MVKLKRFKINLILFVLFYHEIYCLNTYKRKKIVVQGDLMIGALIPVHEQPSYMNDEIDNGSKRKCGIIRDQYGIQRVEALLYILDKINNKNITQLLPGVKLGLEIRDECWDSSIALEETIDFIKDTISFDDRNEELETTFLNKTFYSNDLVNKMSSSNTICTNGNYPLVQKENTRQNKIIAVIGPAGSSVAINVQNLLQLFDITQISYSATSRDLSDKKMFKTFLRVVPSDYLQVKAIADVVVKMNWTYIFAIYTDGSYGQAGMEAFRNETSYLNICIALYQKIREYASKEDYEIVIKKMNQTTSNANVIVCFCYGETIRGLLVAINKLGLKGRFLILGSDGWSDRIDVAQDYYEEAVGSLSFKAHSPVVTEFHDYFQNLKPNNQSKNVWFNEYWEERFRCYIDESSKNKYTTPCQRKCPIDFIQVDNHCFSFSTKNKYWEEAQKECKQKNSYADLIDLNDYKSLQDLFNYIRLNNLTKYLNELHVKIKTSEYLNISQYLNQNKIDITNSDEQIDLDDLSSIIKVKLCKSHINRYSKSKRDYKISGDLYEMITSGENLITFFNSKLNEQNSQYISILITNETNHEYFIDHNDKNRKSYSYCIELKNYERKLPFVCKYEGKYSERSRKYELVDFFPDSLYNYQQDPKMSYVMNSLLAVVHGLDKIHKKWCNGTSGMCERMKKLNGSELLKNIQESSYLGITGENINFDSNGDPPGRYVILNVQKKYDSNTNQVSYFYKEVGSWDTDSHLNLNLNEIVYPNNKDVLNSVCSEHCSFGHVKQIKQGGLKCCWMCKKCEDHSYILDEYTCHECLKGYWPNKNLTGCERLPLVYFKWNEPASIFAILISAVGISVNTFVTQKFIKYSNTCVVKSTTKELSFIILVGVYLSYLMTFPLLMKPSEITCGISRVLPGFSLSLIYGALITKTNRISRILARSKKRILTKKLKFVSLTAQIIISCIIIAIECLLIIGTYFYEYDQKLIIVRFPQRNIARIECYDSFLSVLGPLGYNMFLVGLCTFYAIRTRNLPENFNEAKFIGFAMYTTCVIWIAFIPLYFGSDFKVITLCLSTSFSATVVLIFLFVPKLYIILFEPEKNQRSAFATTKDLRMHFGGSNDRSKSNDSKKTIAHNEVLIDRNPKSKNTNTKSLSKSINRSCQTSINLLNLYENTEKSKIMEELQSKKLERKLNRNIELVGDNLSLIDYIDYSDSNNKMDLLKNCNECNNSNNSFSFLNINSYYSGFRNNLSPSLPNFNNLTSHIRKPFINIVNNPINDV